MKTKTGKLVMRSQNPLETSMDERNSMWDLYHKNYNDVTREEFDRDFNEKTHVFVGRDTGDDSIQGFSTAKIYEQVVDGKKIGIIYSGDTMINKEYWGQKSLNCVFMKEVALWKLKHPFTPLYWLIITMGYRTYLIMAKNAVEYWPRYDRETPKDKKNLIDAISLKRFGSDYDPKTGVITPQNTNCTLGEHVAPMTADLLNLPQMKFFVKSNPNYEQGSELVNICRLDIHWFIKGVTKTVIKLLPFSRAVFRPAVAK